MTKKQNRNHRRFAVVAIEGHPLHPNGHIISEWPTEETAAQAAEENDHPDFVVVKSKAEADMDRHYRPFVRLIEKRKRAKLRSIPKMAMKEK